MALWCLWRSIERGLSRLTMDRVDGVETGGRGHGAGGGAMEATWLSLLSVRTDTILKLYLILNLSFRFFFPRLYSDYTFEMTDCPCSLPVTDSDHLMLIFTDVLPIPDGHAGVEIVRLVPFRGWRLIVVIVWRFIVSTTAILISAVRTLIVIKFFIILRRNQWGNRKTDFKLFSNKHVQLCKKNYR